jgi:hypothetical protein
MPLRCTSPEGEELAFRHSESTWVALRARNSADRHLKMACCGASVVLKQSRLGTRFFAHSRRGACTSAPETAEHLLLKEVAARAANQAGWEARTEVAGQSPDGAQWIADVLCSRPGTRGAVAIELQWSTQTRAQTKVRQRQYRDSGVRALWIMRQHDIPLSRDTPAFTVRMREDGDPQVLLPSQTWSEYTTPARAVPQNEHLWKQRIPLDVFVAGALTGRLKFAPAIGKIVPANVLAAANACWKCGETTQIVLGIDLLTERVFPGFGNVHIAIDDIGSGPDSGASWTHTHLPAELLRSHGIGEIKLRWSKTEAGTYLSNGCVRCDALQGRFHYHEIYDMAPLFETEVSVEPWLVNGQGRAYGLNRWWFETASQPNSDGGGHSRPTVSDAPGAADVEEGG